MMRFDAITTQLEAQSIELPFWAFGNSGARFNVFTTPGTPRTIEEKFSDQIRSVLNVQEMTPRALLVDGAALLAARNSGDVLGANGIPMDAFYTDVRPDIAAWRESRGLPADAMAAYAASGHQQQIATERVGGTHAGWGA